MKAKKFKVLIIFDDVCRTDGFYSINDILAYDELHVFLNQRGVNRVVAYEYLLHGSRKSLINFVQALRKLADIEYEAYFITPFGLINETGIIPPYRECLRVLGMDIIKTLLLESNVIEKLYNLLLDQEIDLHILFLSKKVAKFLILEDIFPSTKKIILVTDEPFSVDIENVLLIYPSKPIEDKARKFLGLNGRVDFFEIAWRVLYKLISALVTKKIGMSYLKEYVNSFIQLLNSLKEIYQVKQVLLREEEKPIATIKAFPYERIVINSEKLIVNREIVFVDEKILDFLENANQKIRIDVLVDKYTEHICKKWASNVKRRNIEINCVKSMKQNTLIIENEGGGIVDIFFSREPERLEINEDNLIFIGDFPINISSFGSTKLALILGEKEFEIYKRRILAPLKLVIVIEREKLEKTINEIKDIEEWKNMENIYLWDKEVFYMYRGGELKKIDKKIDKIIELLFSSESRQIY